MPPNEGIVLAVGDGPPELPDFKMPVAPGDHVLFPRSAGVWVEVEDERLLVCRVREILGVIESGLRRRRVTSSASYAPRCRKPSTRRHASPQASACSS